MTNFLRRALIAAAFLTAAPSFAATEAAAPFDAAAAVSDDGLAIIAGQADVAMVINAENRATVSNNSVSGTSRTGDINFDGGAFASLNGLSLLSANTGNNVAINSSLNVNVALRP